MSLSATQIDPFFKTALGRPATDFEAKQYAGASPQTLGNLKNIYGSYNKDSSIVDYLKFNGQDPSPENRIQLASKYGITNLGSAEGNTALLNAIKTGKPAPAPTPSVAGTVSNATAPTTQPTTSPAVSGSVSSAATPVKSPEGITNEEPPAPTGNGYTDALGTYNYYQSKVASIDQEISNVQNYVLSEVQQNGGNIDASLLASIVGQRTKTLQGQRTYFASQQSAASKDLSSAQAEQRLNLSAWKNVTIKQLDSAGNVVGQYNTWVQNPSSTGASNVIASSNSAQYKPTTSGNGGISDTGETNVGNTAPMPKLSTQNGNAPAQVYQSLISGPAVTIKGAPGAPVSQQTLYNLAIADMLGTSTTVGGRTPSAAILAVKNKETDIMNAYGLTPFDVATAKSEMAGLTSANTALLSTAAFTNASAFTANANLQLALDASANVPRGGAKFVNNYKQWASGEFTPNGPLAEFQTYIYTAAREYAKVTSGSAQSAAGLTDSAQAEADKLISASQSPEVFAQVVQAMQADMQSVTAGYTNQISSYPDSVKKLYGLASSDATAGADASAQVTPPVTTDTTDTGNFDASQYF